MNKKVEQPKYHDEAANNTEDFQSGRGTGKNEDHNLFAAGSVIGQRINTNTYDSRYTRKRGMRFFTIAVAALFVFAVVFLLINPYHDITVIYANDSGIIMHKVDVNVFGRYLLKEDYLFSYDYEGLEYGRLKGKSAQLAVMAEGHDADIIIADSRTLLELGLENHLINHSHYTGNTRSDLLLRHDLFENDLDLLYGLKMAGIKIVDTSGADTISILSTTNTSYMQGKDWKAIKHFVECLYEGLDYTTERIG